MRIVLTLLALAGPVLWADTIHQDIVLDVDDGMIVFANDAIALGIDSTTGSWRELRDRPSGRTVMSASRAPNLPDDGLENQWFLGRARAPWRYTGKRTRTENDGSVALQIDQETRGWRATVTYRLWPARPVMRRDVALTPTADAPDIARNVRLMMDGIAIADTDDARYSILANWPPKTTAFADLTPGRTVNEDWSGSVGHFVVAHSEAAQLGLVATMVCESESSGLRVTEQADALRIDHLIWTAFHPRVGKAERFGSQLICVTHGGWRDALRQGRDLYDLVALTPPADMVDAAAETVIYSAHAGGTIDSGWRDVGGFSQFAEGLPELKKLGINVLWLLPFWEGPVYAPVDYYALDPALGTVADLKSLVDQAHALDIRVLGDLIPHGPRDESGLHEEHRDWVSTNEDGTMQYWWGCLSCDYAHPGWQNYMGDHAAHWVREVGLDGYRVDCAMGGPTNWKPYGDNRPTMSHMYGGAQVLRVAREKMREVKDEVLLLAEGAGPPLMRYADYTYDWPLCWNILRRLPGERAEDFVPALAQWLENEQYWLPKGANLIHFLENHDSVRAQTVHGPGPQRALMALCAFIPGSPFVYHFQEIGMAPHLQRLYSLRRRLPELMNGEADFLSVRCDHPQVMVFTRADGERTSIVAINFSGVRQECVLTLPESLDGFAPKRFDALRGARVRQPESGRLSVTLKPFATAVIVDRSREIPVPLRVMQVAGEPEPLPPEVLANDEEIVVRNAHIELVIGSDNGGLIKAINTLDGTTLLEALSLEEGKRRLWLGADRLSLGAEPLQRLTSERVGEDILITAAGALTRHTGGNDEPIADYVASYRIGADPQVDVTYQITARAPVENILGAFTETLRLDPWATEWRVNTIEGELHDWALARRPSDTRYTGRYWHGAGDRVWQSRELPLAPNSPTVAVRSEPGQWLAVDFTPPTRDGLAVGTGLVPSEKRASPDNVMLKMRHNETVGAHLIIEWLDGRHPVTLQRGESLTFGYAIRQLKRGGPPSGAPVDHPLGAATLRVRGSRYEITNGKYDLALTRYDGGRIADLRLCADDQPLINSSRIYTDAGIYPDRTTPNMVKVRSFVGTDGDSETEVRIRREGAGCRLTFEGLLRSAPDGRGLASPRTRYRVAYTIDDTSALRVEVGVKPLTTVPQAEAFIAQTLALPRFDSFEVNAAGGLARGAPDPGAERVWESKREGFAEDPWMLCKTGTGRALRIAGPELATAFQNAFLFRGGGDTGAVFLALNDFAPADIRPVWYQARYTITPLREAE